MSKPVQRTFGWVQNPSDFGKLKMVVGLFVKDSESNKAVKDYRLPLILNNELISQSDYDCFVSFLNSDDPSIPYAVLKGAGAGGKHRSNALCTGLAQAAIDKQKTVQLRGVDGTPVTLKMPYSDDWTTDGFLRWAISIGFLAYDRGTDCVSVTDAGREFASARNPRREKEVLGRALLSYPPVSRVLSVLDGDKSGNGLTKFEIGASLGFKGEMGFTSIDQGYYLALISQTDEPAVKSQIKQNVEGGSDKYARMIASWLQKMDWVRSSKKTVSGMYRGVLYSDELLTYKITAMGEAALRNSRGRSSNARQSKIVLFEMLATKAPNAGYLRRRRAFIIRSLSRPRSVADICKFLNNNGIEEESATVKDDISGLIGIGLDIVKDARDKFLLKDKVEGLSIPVDVESKADITVLKEKVRSRLRNVSHQYLVLIDLAYSDASKDKKNADAREFEIQTANLLTKELSFNGGRLGDADRPDVAVWIDDKGIIIDNKSYKDGFSIGRHNEDEMRRYITQAQERIPHQPKNEWWRIFPDGIMLHYLFVTSFLKGGFKENLSSLHALCKNINGGAISVENLLYVAEKVRRGDISEYEFPSMLTNDEVSFEIN